MGSQDQLSSGRGLRAYCVLIDNLSCLLVVSLLGLRHYTQTHAGMHTGTHIDTIVRQIVTELNWILSMFSVYILIYTEK